MSRPLKLDKDGRLAVSEAAVERSIREYFETAGWLYIPTKAEHLTRAGAPAHKAGTLDAIALKPMSEPGLRGWAWCIYLELKRRKARTERKHLAAQTATAKDLIKRGALVYQAPENEDDPIGHFQRWIRARGL